MNRRNNNPRRERARRPGGDKSALRLPPSAFAKPSAFTLVELLVVIVIISILAALLIPAVTNARVAANQRAIQAEIGNVDGAIESYKNDVAGSYPPDAMMGDYTYNPNSNTPAAQVASRIFSDFKRHFKKAFPRHRESDDLLKALCGAGVIGGNGITSPESNSLSGGGMTPAENLVFFLQRFSSDPRYPISGPGGPAFVYDTTQPGNGEDLASRQWILAFNENSYGPRDDENFYAGRFLQYTEGNSDLNGNGVNGETLRINFWVYTPKSRSQPLVYFDASRGLHDIHHDALGADIHPLKQLKAGATASDGVQLGDLRLANDGKFQILHCGNDGAWGDFEAMHIDPTVFVDGTDLNTTNAPDGLLLYPTGPFTLDLADTVSNFVTEASLEDAQQ